MNRQAADEARAEARAWRDRHLMPLLHPATPTDYMRWLNGYVANGGHPTHRYDYPIGRADFYVAVRSFSLEHGLFGSASINIIVPEGVEFLGGDLGHCNLYYMDGFGCRRDWVPTYSDARVLPNSPLWDGRKRRLR